MVVDATEKNPSHTWKSDVARDRANLWPRGDEFKCAREFLGERIGRLFSVLTPPAPRFLDVPRSATSEADRKRVTHPLP